MTDVRGSTALDPYRPDASTWRQLHGELCELLRAAAAANLIPGVTAIDVYERSAQAALRRLIHGQGGPEDERQLGQAIAGSRVVHIEATPATTQILTSALATTPGALVTSVGAGSLVVLIRDMPRAVERDRSLSMARAVASHVHRLGPDAAIGISDAVQSADRLRAAALDAADAAQLAADDPARTIEVADRWADIALLKIRRQISSSRHTFTPVHELVDYDSDHGTAFTETLRVWLRNNQDSRRTADELRIHPNTLRYRIRRASTLARVDLANPSQRLVLELLLT